MSIDAIRARLVTNLGQIAGVLKVWKDEPPLQISPADCPSFVLAFRDPACSARSNTNSSVEYTWHFDLTFLYKPEGLGNVDENMSALEDFVKLTVDKLCANITGGGTWVMWNKDTGGFDFTLGILTRPNASAEQNRYWGFTATLDITEYVNTTMSAGT